MTVAAPFALSTDQQAAMDKFNLFISDPSSPVFTLSGFSGTGKSTLIKTLLDQLPAFMKTLKLINPSFKELEVRLTATTNKAAEAFGQITGMEVSTIHSLLGLRVVTDYKTNTSSLVAKNNDTQIGLLLFVDEASFIDSALLDRIFKGTSQCKIVFIGDPAQLTPIKATSTPVFEANFPGAHLSQVVRQAEGNPIISLSTMFRETVSSGEFFSFKPDGNAIQYMDRDTFNKAIEAEFTRPDWRYHHSKMLGWTNKCVIGYNQYVSSKVSGDPSFQTGDYAVCNSFLTIGRNSIKTDQMVCISGISEDERVHDVLGNWFMLDYSIRAFMPKTLADRNARIKQARAEEDYTTVAHIESQWADLRAAYACTINKAQGSTFDKVFIDLDDISRCNSGDQIARMMYVAVSRARHQVFLTGDFVS